MTTNTIFEVNSQDEISKQEKMPLLTSSDDSFDITETDRIKELNLNEYETFLGKTCLKIPLSIFNHLLVGEIGEIPPKTRYHPRKKKSKSSTNNTNLLNLPDQILINIFEYLPPLKIIILRQTCIKCSNLSQDRQLWRQVCINNNQLFIWKELRIKIVFFNEQNIIYGFQNDLVEKITGKKIKIRKNRNNRTFRNKLLDSKTSELEPLTNANIRISYIETLKNPEKHFKLKYKKLQHAKQQIQNLAEQNDEQDLKFQKQSIFRKRVIKTLWYPVLLLSYSYILFTILINLTVSKKLQNTNKFWVFSPIFINLVLIFIFICCTIIRSFSRYIVAPILTIILYYVAISFPLFLIFLKIMGVFKISYAASFSLLYIYLSILFMWAIVKTLRAIIVEYDLLTLIKNLIIIMLVTFPFLFLIFLSVKLDKRVNWNWGVVFLPIFIFDCLPCILPIFSWVFCVKLSNILTGEEFKLLSIMTGIFSAVILPSAIFELLLVLFLQTSLISHFTIVMIPIYLIDLLLFIFSSILIFSSLTKNIYEDYL